jgi:hypothetical protein
MIDLEWKCGNGRALSFEDIVPMLEMNRNGFYIVASVHGKVTNVCYGNILQLHSIFIRNYNSGNFFKIMYFTYAFYEDENKSKEILSQIQKSLYHNPDYKLNKGLVRLPEYILFSELYKSYCIIISDKTEALDRFSKLEIIAKENELLDKLECKLVLTKFSNNYEIYIVTTSFYDREFNIIKQFGKGFFSQDQADLNNNLLKIFGEIKDWKPSC